MSRTWMIGIVVATLVGVGTGYLAGSLATPSRTAPAPQTREFWVIIVVTNALLMKCQSV